jgi:hypothetical protein
MGRASVFGSYTDLMMLNRRGPRYGAINLHSGDLRKRTLATVELHMLTNLNYTTRVTNHEHLLTFGPKLKLVSRCVHTHCTRVVFRPNPDNSYLHFFP